MSKRALGPWKAKRWETHMIDVKALMKKAEDIYH